MKVFVTVGTTKFEALLRIVFSQEVQNALKAKGYNKVKAQIGHSVIDLKEAQELKALDIEIYDFKSSLADDIREADLVIAHAGAGTTLEVLEAKKPLIVVVNDDLMGNHQVELAERLALDGHLVYCFCGTLVNTIHNFDPESLKPYTKGNTANFAKFVDDFMSK